MFSPTGINIKQYIVSVSNVKYITSQPEDDDVVKSLPSNFTFEVICEQQELQQNIENCIFDSTDWYVDDYTYEVKSENFVTSL